MEKKPVCRLCRKMLNYDAAQLHKFDSLRDVILSTYAKGVIIVGTKRKINRKMRQWEGSGMPGTDCIVIVSHLVENVYRGSFHKRVRRDHSESIFFGYIKKRSELFHFSFCFINVYKFRRCK
jgi:hypothetical protein